MLQSIREKLTLVLIALLPFHAFMVTVGTRYLQNANVSPLKTIAVWKEALLGIIIVFALAELFLTLRNKERRKEILGLDYIDVLIAGLCCMGVLISTTIHADSTMILYGFRYDFIGIAAFVVLRRIAWSDPFRQLAQTVLVTVGAIVALWGIITLFLPSGFFSYLGYSDLHSLYVPEGAIAAFQYIGGTGIRRLQSTFSGPNHLGLWLLIPISFVLLDVLQSRLPARRIFQKLLVHITIGKKTRKWICLMALLLLVFALLLTFSRSAWIGALVLLGAASTRHVEREKLKQILIRYGALCFFIIFLSFFLFSDVILRKASTIQHLQRPIEAAQIMLKNPLGLGLGTAGPASNRVSDACVYLQPNVDASWAEAHSNLCVFLGRVQVQPTDRQCSCPLLPENWYLQMGVEMGWAGMAIFIMLTLIVLAKLASAPNDSLGEGIFVAMLALCVASFFLHAWEDAAVMYTIWILAATSRALDVMNVEKD